MCLNCSRGSLIVPQSLRQPVQKTYLEGSLQDRKDAFGLLGPVKLGGPVDLGTQEPLREETSPYEVNLQNLDSYPISRSDYELQHFTL